ncbi:MAG TPA: deoxynucleoside kinase [Patescibacteria group bacterium]|nr:deoxynucleoside kinase [Patescibacteria group bacterium]
MSLEKFSPPEMVTFLGVETSGKTTMSRLMAKRMGGCALRVATWPSLDRFLTSPADYAYENQSEAMDYTLRAKREAIQSQPLPLFADSSPERVHQVHSWNLLREGLLAPEDWEKLEEQYAEACEDWGSHYVYLHADLDTIRSRLLERNRPEDLEYNLQAATMFIERWEDLVTDPQWRQEKHVLELESETPLDELCDTTEQWIRDQS